MSLSRNDRCAPQHPGLSVDSVRLQTAKDQKKIQSRKKRKPVSKEQAHGVFEAIAMDNEVLQR